MVRIELGKNDIILISLLVVLVSVGFTYAYRGNNPSALGHSGGEIELDGDTVMTDEFCRHVTGSDCVGGSVAPAEPSAPTCASNMGADCDMGYCYSGTVLCDGSCGDYTFRPAGTSCGTGLECDGSWNCVSACVSDQGDKCVYQDWNSWTAYFNTEQECVDYHYRLVSIWASKDTQHVLEYYNPATRDCRIRTRKLGEVQCDGSCAYMF